MPVPFGSNIATPIVNTTQKGDVSSVSKSIIISFAIFYSFHISYIVWSLDSHMSIITHPPQKVKSHPSPRVPKFLRSHLTKTMGSSLPFIFLLVSYLYVFLMPTSIESAWRHVGSQTTRNLPDTDRKLTSTIQ